MPTRYPPSDHYDGRVFFNLGDDPNAVRRRLRFLLRWRLQRGERGPWPSFVPLPGFPPPGAISVPKNGAAITFLGHASFLIRLPSLTVLTDPVFSERCSPVSWAGPRRVSPPGVALTDLPRPDIVLISHNHYDHMDVTSLRTLSARHAPRCITTLGNKPFLAKHGIVAEELDWWQSTEPGPLRITATPARHFAARGLFDRNHTLWAGFMIEIPQGRILFAGDSGAGPHWRMIRDRLGAPDLALLPIGAYEPRWMMQSVHMNPEEAVAAHLALDARQSLGMHFGMFHLADEAFEAPVEALAAARTAAGLAAEDFAVLGLGETRAFPFAIDDCPSPCVS